MWKEKFFIFQNTGSASANHVRYARQGAKPSKEKLCMLKMSFCSTPTHPFYLSSKKLLVVNVSRAFSLLSKTK